VRLYSPEWVAAWNDAVAGLAPAGQVAFRMLQVVDGGPDGTLRVALDAGTQGIALLLDPADEPTPQLTVSLSYEDAAALARGAVDPARLVAEGRVRVRGDLAVLVTAQAILAEAAARLEGLSVRTTL
jgi:ubiquinone biosynthesis protein UbiJ